MKIGRRSLASSQLVGQINRQDRRRVCVYSSTLIAAVRHLGFIETGRDCRRLSAGGVEEEEEEEGCSNEDMQLTA